MLLFIKEAKYLGGYKVELKFTNNRIGIVNLEDELYGTVFEPLKDIKLFSTVKFDKDLETIVWDNGADLAPEFLFYKSFQNDELLQEQFEKWGYSQKTNTISI